MNRISDEIQNYQNRQYSHKIFGVYLKEPKLAGHIISSVLVYNSKHPDKQLYLLFDHLLRRVCAAIIIQRSWKTYRVRNKYWEVINQKLAENRAGLMLKKHIYRYKIKKRERLLHMARAKVAALTEPFFYMLA